MENIKENESSDFFENNETTNDCVKNKAVKKIADELESFKGGNKEKAVSKFVASTLTHFCEQEERFAEVVYKTPRTLSDCCAEVMKGCGNAISDIDVYRGAVKSYFPNAEVNFIMELKIEGAAPSEEEINRKPEVKPAQTKTTAKKAEPKKPEPPPEPETLQLSLF